MVWIVNVSTVMAIDVLQVFLAVQEHVKVCSDKVVVTMLNNTVNQWLVLVRVAEKTGFNSAKHLLQPFWNLDAAIEMLVSNFLDRLGQVTEKENVFLADFSGNFNVGTIHCTDDESTVQGKLHVRRTGRLCSCCGDVIRQVRARADDFGLGHVIVWNEHHLQQVIDFCVLVHHFSNHVNQVDDCLCHVVTWRSLSTNDRCLRDVVLQLNIVDAYALLQQLLDVQVTVDHGKNVQLLSLVLVNSFDLDIKHDSRIHFDSGFFLDQSGQTTLVAELDGVPTAQELVVIHKLFQLLQLT